MINVWNVDRHARKQLILNWYTEADDEKKSTPFIYLFRCILKKKHEKKDIQ